MEEEILEKANELYDLLSKAKEEIEIGNSNQHWVMIETQTALGSGGCNSGDWSAESHRTPH